MPEVLTILLIVAPTGTAGATETPGWEEIEGVVAATGGRVFERTVEPGGANRFKKPRHLCRKHLLDLLYEFEP